MSILLLRIISDGLETCCAMSLNKHSCKLAVNEQPILLMTTGFVHDRQHMIGYTASGNYCDG